MLKTVAWFIKVGIAAVISLVILSLFTFVWSHSGVHITNETGATDYKWEPNQWRATMGEGVAWVRVNADGFNNRFNLADVDHVDILLMGSSHMEAVNVSKDTNTGYLLNNHGNLGLITYNIGMSGHTIYQCVSNLNDAVKYYDPAKFIVIETDRVLLDKGKMNEVVEETFPTISSHDSGLIYKIQKYVPCFLPLYRELDNWIAVTNNDAATSVPGEKLECENYEEYKTILCSFFDKIAASTEGRKVIILYQHEISLDDDGVPKLENVDGLDVFRAECYEHNIEFIDMFDDFYKEFENNHIFAHGFTNTEVGVGHLNMTGHRLVADRLETVIKELEDGAE